MHELEPTRLKGIDRARLEAVVTPIVSAHGAEVVDIEWKSDRAGWVLRVFVEKAGAAAQNLSTEAAAVDLELCSNVARELSPALDVADLITHNYHLEVGSPGIERTLRGERDFLRFAGQKARLKLANPVEGQKALRGTLGPIERGPGEGDNEGTAVLLLTDGRRTFRVPLTDILAAQLVFEFGPAPKPGKGKPSSRAESHKHESSKAQLLPEAVSPHEPAPVAQGSNAPAPAAAGAPGAELQGGAFRSRTERQG